MSIQDLTTVIKTGHGSLHDDPQSGSILKLLGENGFKAKIEAGAANGHTYTIIHSSPSTEFLLVDVWNEGEHPRKAYHAFSILTRPAVQSTLSTSVALDPEHPMITYLKQLNADADKLLAQIKQYA